MKCPNCGGQMGLEDTLCPYCGTPNAMAAQHQSDMAHYREEFERTQDEVLEKTSAMQRHGSWLVILVVLLIALVIGIALQANAWDIGYTIREHNVQRDSAVDTQVLDAYLEQGDYSEFVGYYDANDIYLGDDGKYQAVHTAARSYEDIVQYIEVVKNPKAHAYRDDYYSDLSGYLASDYYDLFTLEKQYSYDADRYLPASMRGYIDDIRDRASVIAQAYYGLSEEQVRDIPNISEQKLKQMIEEGITS